MSVQSKVKRILEINIGSRNNDITLCSEVWNEECLEHGLVFSDISVPVFLIMVLEGKISKQQTILRCRRRLNKKHPHLKGKSYNANTKIKPKYIKNKKLPNLIKRAGLEKIKIN